MKFEDLLSRLNDLNSRMLPGDDAHFAMTPYKKNLKVSPENPRLSAVMITLFEENEQAKILLLKRSDYGGIHSAQVSLPGGKKDKEDNDLLHTAQRELMEETGINGKELQMIGQLSPMYIPPSNFLIHPFIGYTTQLPPIRLDERESQYHFGISIKELLDDEFLKMTDIKTSYGQLKNVPYFSMNNEIIWGATAAILNELKWILKK